MMKVAIHTLVSITEAHRAACYITMIGSPGACDA